jgi:quercetin dioxygenase-like cupin family protein
MADDAAKVAPHVYKVIFENEHARLLEVKMEVGGSTEMHSHPATLIHSLADSKVAFTDASGEVAELEVPKGASIWLDATEHATRNVGGTAVHALLFEPK